MFQKLFNAKVKEFVKTQKKKLAEEESNGESQQLFEFAKMRIIQIEKKIYAEQKANKAANSVRYTKLDNQAAVKS
jgi:hypothetical protein